MMNYRAAACVLLVLIVMVMAVDFASSQIRKALV
jgi:ABC-type phosphate/phosphonate transport system permease subunit